VRFYRKTLLLVALALLVACESGLDQRYLDVSLGQPLELPPDLSEFESESNFDLPDSIGGDGVTDGKTVPVLAKVDSVKLESSADLYWLSVDAKVENLYQTVKNFWASEGFGLVIDEPIIGIMETEWIYTEEGGDHKSDSWWANLFDSDDLSATQDQFRTRLSAIEVPSTYTRFRSVKLTRKAKVVLTMNGGIVNPNPSLKLRCCHA
jgi:outer membrane protein assembly factor BamC